MASFQAGYYLITSEVVLDIVEEVRAQFVLKRAESRKQVCSHLTVLISAHNKFLSVDASISLLYRD